MIKILAVTSASALSLALASAAMAQNSATAADGADEQSRDIIITATRQATNLQDTPIAITAVTSEALGERGVTNVADLTSIVPNAQFQKTQGAFGPGVSGTIRGIGSGDTNIGGENAIAYYIDDVYYPLVLGANFDLLDIDHIEVLRGPQGTLFGRNALSGGVNIVAKQPSTSSASAYVEATTGAFDRIDVRAGFNLPISSNAALRISGMSKQRKGSVRVLDFTCDMVRRGTPALAGTYPQADVLKTRQPNFTPTTVDDCTVGRLGGEDVHGGRASFLWEPTAGLKLTFTGDYIRDNSENVADHVVDVDPTRANANIRSQAAYFGLVFDKRFDTGDPFTTYTSYTDRIPAGTVIAIDPTKPATGANVNSYYNGTMVNGRYTRGGYQLSMTSPIKTWGISGKLNWDLTSDISLTAIYGHRDLREYHAFDTDGTPLVVEHTVNDNQERYDNAEVRLAGKMDWMDWVAGVFYFKSFGDQHAALIAPATGGQKSIHTTYDSLSKAVFANATLRPFGDKLGIVLGGRYSDDRKIVDFSNLADTSAPGNTGADIRFVVVPKQKKFSWKAGINYQATPDILVYASAASGNSLPGYNSRPLQKTQVTQFDGNDVVAYELGAKMDLFDRLLRLNVAGFYTDFKNRPSSIGGSEALLNATTGEIVPGNQQLAPLPGGPAGSTTCATTTLPNNPDGTPSTAGITCIGRTYYRNLPATIRGLEAEFTITPAHGFVINGSVGWSKFWSDDIAARTVNRRQGNPVWTANAGAQYDIPADMIGGVITPRIDWTFQSSQVVSGTSTKYNHLLPDRSLFNARVTYRNTDYDFSVALGVTNLFDKRYWVNVFDYQGLGYPQTDAQPGRPREWYLTLRKQF